MAQKKIPGGAEGGQSDEQTRTAAVDEPQDEPQPPEGAEARGEEGAAAPAAAAGPDGPGAGAVAAQPVSERKEQYLVGPKGGVQPQGVQPFDLNLLAQALTAGAHPDIELKKVISSSSLIGALGTLADGPRSQPVLVAAMSDTTAEALSRNAQLVVEPDAPLTYARPEPIVLRDPGVLAPAAAGVTLAIQVVGQGNAPVAGAEVLVFGTLWPAQGVTDAQGQVVLTLFGESPATIRGLYVKPKADYWSLSVTRPQLSPNRVNLVSLVPLEQSFPNFPNQQITGWGQQAMKMDQLPPQYRGAGVKVAIIDSGTATTHQDLNQVNNGFDFTGQPPNAQSWNNDLIAHGSHCAGVVAGLDNPGGIRGFAPDATVFAFKVFPGGRFSDLIEALNHCIQNQIDVANLSLGSDQRSELLEQKIEQAREAGVACIVAAGNSAGPVQFPASLSSVFTVAAVGRLGTFPESSYHRTQVHRDGNAGGISAEGYFSAKFTCFGPEVDVCAPGVAIVSAVPPNNFAAWDGTSMAAPHVAGLAALILAHHPDFGPHGNYRARNAQRVQRLFDILRSSAQPLSVGDRDRTGAGMPDALVALNVGPSTSELLENLLRSLHSEGATAAARPLVEHLRTILSTSEGRAPAGGSGTARSATRRPVVPAAGGEAAPLFATAPFGFAPAGAGNSSTGGQAAADARSALQNLTVAMRGAGLLSGGQVPPEGNGSPSEAETEGLPRLTEMMRAVGLLQPPSDAGRSR